MLIKCLIEKIQNGKNTSYALIRESIGAHYKSKPNDIKELTLKNTHIMKIVKELFSEIIYNKKNCFLNPRNICLLLDLLNGS